LRTAGETANDVLLVGLAVFGVIAAVVVGRLNYIRGRGDRRGALRLAAFAFVTQTALFLFRAHLVPAVATFGLFLLACALSLLVAAILWLLYLALEPYVRRRWPQALVSWSRLLAGRVRDPVVARDVLYGLVLGLVWTLVFDVRAVFMQRL